MTVKSYLVKPLINCLDKEQNYIKFIYPRKSEWDPLTSFLLVMSRNPLPNSNQLLCESHIQSLFFFPKSFAPYIKELCRESLIFSLMEKYTKERTHLFPVFRNFDVKKSIHL